MIFKLSRKRYRKIINALSLFGSFVILATAYISSVYAAIETEGASLLPKTLADEAEMCELYTEAVECDIFEGEYPDTETALSAETLEDAIAADFEKQDIRMYVDDEMYPGRISIKDDSVYVGISDFAKSVSPEAEINESGAAVSVNSDKISLSANDGGSYLIANGRYLWCRYGIISEEGEVMAPLSILCSVFGSSRSDDAGEAIDVHSGGEVIASAQRYYNSDDLYWLSRIISAESCGEPLYGKIAVGNVVLNRVRTPGYPDSVYKVIFDTDCGVQFTPVANGAIDNEPDAESIIAAKLCLEGVSVSKEILYFLNPSVAENFWIMNNRTYITTIGNHEFYS